MLLRVTFESVFVQLLANAIHRFLKPITPSKDTIHCLKCQGLLLNIFQSLDDFPMRYHECHSKIAFGGGNAQQKLFYKGKFRELRINPELPTICFAFDFRASDWATRL